jgi:PIN domain nuclease of toxin-antitoxin system
VRLLLDTHAFLWWRGDDPRLGEVEREAIRDGQNDVFLSAASIWEIVIKQSLGRLRIPEPASAAAARLGFEPLAVSFAHAEATALLPALHRDPFDRMLIAQARTEGLALVTHDPLIRTYPGVAFLPA